MFINNKHEEAHHILKSGDVMASIQLYTEALDMNPGHPDILSDRGVAYLHLNDADKCFEDFNLALEMQPDYAYRYASRAFAKSHFGDLEGAVEDYEKAIELDPDDAVAHNNLGLIYEKMGYFREANLRFERADKLSKIEGELFQIMDDLEGKHEDQPSSETTFAANQTEDDKNFEDQKGETPTGSKEFQKIFTSRKQFREFIDFVRNGFKLK